jgi:hypothetical protein
MYLRLTFGSNVGWRPVKDAVVCCRPLNDSLRSVASYQYYHSSELPTIFYNNQLLLLLT